MRLIDVRFATKLLYFPVGPTLDLKQAKALLDELA